MCKTMRNLLFHAPASSQKSAITVIYKRPAICPASNKSLWFSHSFRKMYLIIIFHELHHTPTHTHTHTHICTLFLFAFHRNPANLQEEQITQHFCLPKYDFVRSNWTLSVGSFSNILSSFPLVFSSLTPHSLGLALPSCARPAWGTELPFHSAINLSSTISRFCWSSWLDSFSTQS